MKRVCTYLDPEIQIQISSGTTHLVDTHMDRDYFGHVIKNKGWPREHSQLECSKAVIEDK